ncbi:MAG: hypothetical protein V4481_02340 [Patescibacteria group bacterium]
MKLKYLLIILAVLILIGAGAAYWYYFTTAGIEVPVINPPTPTDSNGGFVPFNRPPTSSSAASTTAPLVSATSTPSNDTTVAKVPGLRLISNTPVGGYGASTTAETTIVRWVDRGRGNIYEASGASLEIQTLSNTVVPRIYESAWNRNGTAFIASMLPENASTPTSVYVELQKQISSSTTSYTLKGKNLPSNTLTYAVSPKGDKLVLLLDEGSEAVGYTSTFSGQSLTRLFSTPLKQVTIEWPEESFMTLTTKPSYSQDGFLYFISSKTGTMKKVLGPLAGLSTKVSRDGRFVLESYVEGTSHELHTSIYTVAKNASAVTGFVTLADKCVWGNFYKDVLYCGVPTQPPTGLYPDDWYIGSMSFKDKIWQANATTGELKLVSALSGQNRSIDAYDLGLDRNDNYLFFINKDDLTLWSLDLVAQ